MISAAQLARIIPNGRSRVSTFLDPLNAAMAEFGIDTPRRQVPFIAQCAHESREFSALVENLNYSADGLRGTFPGRFTIEQAESYARHPERIANFVYAVRMGNGDEASGDGWRYRGRGLIQVTGRAGYRAASEALGVDLIAVPDLLLTTENACRSAAFFWKAHELNDLADQQKFDAISRVVNGIYKHFREGDLDRYAYYESACAALGLTSGENVA